MLTKARYGVTKGAADLSVGAASTKIKEDISFSAPNTAFPANVNPQTVFNALTLGSGTTPSPSTSPPTMSPEVDYHVKRGQSVIDLVRGDLTRLQNLKMSTADQGRVQDWLDLLRDTEVGVGGMTGGGTTANANACTADTATKLGVTSSTLAAASPTGQITGGVFSGGTPSAEGDKNLATSFTLGGDMMMNLIALNMICDANRVLTLLYPACQFTASLPASPFETSTLASRSSTGGVGSASPRTSAA